MRGRPARLRATRWFLVGLFAEALSACDVTSSRPEPIVIRVAFGGYAAHLASTTTTLVVSSPRRSYQWVGDHSVHLDRFAPLAEIQLLPGDSIHAIARVVGTDGSLIAEVLLARQVQRGYEYGLSFQVGGRNPDLSGFCHQSPSRASLSSSQADTLYLLWSALPIGAVC